MRRFSLIASLLVTIAPAQAKSLLPTAEGMTWQYQSAGESEGRNNSTIPSALTRRISGSQEFKGKNLLRLETFYGDVLSKTELIAVDRNGIRCFARSSQEGQIIPLASPQTIVPAPLKVGTSWESDDEVSDVSMHEHCIIAGAENVSVPAGNFHAFRFHGEQSSLTAIVIDRWFVPGIGFVKEVTTMRSPSRELLGNRTLELTRLPRVTVRPASESFASAKKLLVSVSSQPVGKLETEFSSTVQNIYARWQGNGLRNHAKVRAVWIAEDVGDIAPPNYKIDDATTTVGASDSHGIFTLSRPENGWAEGKYRVEFFLDGTLVETVRLKIARASPNPAVSPFGIHE